MDTVRVKTAYARLEKAFVQCVMCNYRRIFDGRGDDIT